MYVLITGASGGLGRAFALDCAERNYNLFLTDINKNGLEKVKCGIERQYDVKVTTWVCDITVDEQVNNLIAYARKIGISFDMLINVAGIDHEGGFIKRSFENITEILRVNIEATLRITYKVLMHRSEKERFYIIFVSSLASMCPIPLKSTYAASKRFLLDFSLALGQELKNENVSVLSLCPGGLATTPTAIRGIEAQGFWGAITTNRLEKVVYKTVSGVLRGKNVYIPGGLNRLFSIAVKLIPANAVAKLLYNRWYKAQSKWLFNSSNGGCQTDG